MPSGPTYAELTQEFVPHFYGPAAAPFIFDYLTLMTASAAQHGVIGNRSWEGRKPGIFASICQAYLTPDTVIRAATILKAAAAVTAVAAPASRYTARLARAQLPMYLTVLGRWTEMLEFWQRQRQNSSATDDTLSLTPHDTLGSQHASNTAAGADPPRAPPWPFEHTFEAAFAKFNSTMSNTRDPLKLPVSDYYATVHGITMDDSAEAAVNYWHLISQHGPATAICSK